MIYCLEALGLFTGRLRRKFFIKQFHKLQTAFLLKRLTISGTLRVLINCICSKFQQPNSTQQCCNGASRIAAATYTRIEIRCHILEITWIERLSEPQPFFLLSFCLKNSSRNPKIPWYKLTPSPWKCSMRQQNLGQWLRSAFVSDPLFSKVLFTC